jgi:biotin synthesis protein BioG
MKLYWKIKEENPRLLLFFNGWGGDEYVFSDIIVKEMDVLMVFDYKNIDMNDFPDLNNYKDIVVLAWSFGVYVGDQCLPFLPAVNCCIAVNGTLIPVDDTFGIPVDIFHKTLQNFDERSRKKFSARIMGGLKEAVLLVKYLPRRTTEDQKDELESLTGMFAKGNAVHPDYWTIALLSESDKIFPVENMKRYWKDKGIVMEGNHFPDFQYIIDHYVQ